jgi:ribosome biogenesis GTPase
VDSPGVRDLELSVRDPGEIGPLFRDIRAVAPHCRFANCLHLQEPGCAVKESVEAGTILQSRYTSYKWLMTTMQQAKDRKYD